ncbi:MAG: zinc-dependent alcohol dehydrogenase [Anaerolineae bacterium]
MPRRLAFVGPFQADILTYEEPELEPNQVRVKTTWASGKHGTTTAMFEGGAFQGQEFDQEMRIFVPSEQPPRMPTPESPWPSGTTGVGTIVEVGSAVEAWAVGDTVFGLMDIRETNVCEANWIWSLGEIEPELALCIEPAYVAFHCIRESNVRYGDSVMVIGLGALGLLTVRMAAAAGVERLFAVDPLPNRRAWALDRGADAVYDPYEGDVALEVHRQTDGKGADVAIELSGTYPGLATAIRSARIGGTVCSAGFYQREAHGLWLGREWHHNRLTMVVPHGCGWGHPPRDYPRWDQQRAYDVLASMMRQGKLTAPGLIQPVVTLEEAVTVFDLVRDEPEKVIKYAVRFAEDET